jgi:hypothetical protein
MKSVPQTIIFISSHYNLSMKPLSASCHCIKTPVLMTMSRVKKQVLLWLLVMGITLNCLAQSPTLPPGFFSLKTNRAKAAFLRKMIGDSVSKSAYTYVPALSHQALSYAAGLPADTFSPILYQFLGDAYEDNNQDSAIYYYRRSLQAFKKPGIIKKLYLHQSLLYAFSALDNKDSMLHYIHELEQLITTLPDTNSSKLMVTNTIASSYGALNQYEKAVRHYGWVIRLAMQQQDSIALRNAFVNTGLMYNETNDDRMAANYTLAALPYLDNDPYSNLIIFSNLADYYTMLSILDSAKYFLSKAEKQAALSKNEASIYTLATKRANLLLYEKKYRAAEPLLENSLSYFMGQPPGVELVNCLLIYAALDTAVNNYTRAEQHLITLYKITKNMNRKVYMLEALRPLVQVNEHLGDYKDAYTYQKLLIATSDSIKADKATERLAELQTQYQTYKKEETINSLQKESRIKSLEIQAARRNKTLFLILGIILLATLGILWYIRSLRSKAGLQTLKAKLEMKALRSQMNPHFIFNSLNSIQKYIWENRQEDASEYLTKFARLIRLVLENSRHAAISVEEELNALRLYIEMEHRRNNQKFDYSITLAPDIDATNTFIPPLLLQPYVENAIWHGLSPKDERGKLTVSLEKKNGTLVCTIDDNGIGRHKAATLRTDAIPKTSMAMNISNQRIEWLQKEAGFNATVTITDKQADGLATGTTVLLTLPLTIQHD